ncbi:PREDICTED: stathmin domain-containing protein 1 [Acanthisitta chloris]|uniref:stathmin domain-containing protein 1 n=1 Tax=Acanthisitta chloris TaxID=57068 RepID=UPI0004F0D109|nr:PREDICTED: stathmin domain-containing protein 1 [Acanthisitta chloris]
MGCNFSNQVTVTQVSSEDLQNHQEVKSHAVTSSPQTTKNDSSDGTEKVPSQTGAAWPTGTSKDGDKAEDETSEGESPEELPERFTSFQINSNSQSIDSKFISKSLTLEERQKSSDILEELRVQGIIKGQSTTARTGEAYKNKRDALEKALKKPPVRLEKIQFGNEEVGDFTVKDMKTSAEAKKQSEKDCPNFESQGGIDTLQSSPLDGEPGVLLKKITAVEATNNYSEDSVIKSDTLDPN